MLPEHPLSRGPSEGASRFALDVQAGVFRVSSDADPGHTVEARPHLISTFDVGQHRLWWGWGFDCGDEVSAQLHTYGIDHGIADLVEQTVPFPAVGGDRNVWADGSAHQIGKVAVEATGRDVY